MRKIKQGDEIIVITGRDKGKRGVVTRVLDAGRKLLIDGINVVKKSVTPNPDRQERGGIKEKSVPIDASNVMVYNPQTGKGDRIGIRTLENGRKVRYFKSNKEVVGT